MSNSDNDSRFSAKITEAFARVGGPGLIGRMCGVMFAVLIFACIVVGKLNDAPMILLVFFIIVLLVVAFGIASFWYANLHPDHSSADGEMLYRLRALQIGASDQKLVSLNAPLVDNADSKAVIEVDNG